MKTKFFRKLSFVLVVAMVLSLFVPAAGAFAASSVKLNSTKKYLHLDVEKLNTYNFNILSQKGKGWKYFWESDDESVAVVKETNGVATATGVGKATITLTITDKDDEVVDTATATVIVRDNIKEVTIKNPVDKLAVGEEHDYNRSFKTVSGSTKKTSAITRWTVDSKDATIDDKGVFKATKAGTYKVTALSFQSQARYDVWLEDAEKAVELGYVLDTDETTVVVAGSMEFAKQVDLDTFKVQFDSDMDEAAVKANLKVSLLVGTVKSPQYVKSIALDKEDASVALVDMYGPFAKGATYVAEYTDMEDVDFKAASTNYSDVVRMTIDTKSVQAGKEEVIKFTLYNADDVDITAGTDANYSGELKAQVTLETESVGAYVYDNKISIFEVGTVADVKGTYKTYQYDDQGKELGTVYAIGQIVGVKEATVAAGALSKWTITTGGKGPDWNKLNNKVALGPHTSKLHAEVKDTDGKELYSGSDEDKFSFESTNDSKLYVVPSTGELWPISDGSVTVVIKFDNQIVGYANVVILPESKAISLTLDEYAFTLSIDSDVADSKTIKATLKDQYEEDADVVDSKTSITHLETANSRHNDILFVRDGKEITFTVKPGAEEGKAVFEVKFNDLKKIVTITLADPNDGGDAAKIKYRLVMDKTLDLAIEETADLANTLDIKLVGFAPNGVKTTANVATDGAFSIKLSGPQDIDFQVDPALYGNASGEGADTNVITKIKTGTYKVVAMKGTTVVDTQYLLVTDSQKKAELTKVKETLYEKTDLKKVAYECFEIKIDGVEIKEADVYKVITIGPEETGGPIYIKEVQVKQSFGTEYIIHTVTVGMTVRPK